MQSFGVKSFIVVVQHSQREWASEYESKICTNGSGSGESQVKREIIRKCFKSFARNRFVGNLVNHRRPLREKENQKLVLLEM